MRSLPLVEMTDWLMAGMMIVMAVEMTIWKTVGMTWR
jgi:hypothetical protein